MNIEKLNELYKDEVVKVRRTLHQIPEHGFKEYKTSAYIKAYLDECGISYEPFAGTGLLAYVKGNNPSKTIGFRTDMDALSILEMNEVDFKSTHEGFMHACGHDGHMTIALTFLKFLSEHKENLKDNVAVLFQPAEEGLGGAEAMLKDGVFEKYPVDEIFGIHLHPSYKERTMAINHGPIMAMTGQFEIDIHTKSAHGAMPHLGNDGMIVLAQLINQLQTIVSRNIDPTERAVLTLGKVEGGTRRNIIAEHIRLEGIVRCFNEDVFHLIEKRVNSIIKGLEISYDCTIDNNFRLAYPPVINHKESIEQFKKANKDITLVEYKPEMIAEDFSYYVKETKGAFVFLGVRNEEKNYIFPLHSSHFNFDENVLLTGVLSYINILNSYGSTFNV